MAVPFRYGMRNRAHTNVPFWQQMGRKPTESPIFAVERPPTTVY